jgi:hypothetical protein
MQLNLFIHQSCLPTGTDHVNEQFHLDIQHLRRDTITGASGKFCRHSSLLFCLASSVVNPDGSPCFLPDASIMLINKFMWRSNTSAGTDRVPFGYLSCPPHWPQACETNPILPLNLFILKSCLPAGTDLSYPLHWPQACETNPILPLNLFILKSCLPAGTDLSCPLHWPQACETHTINRSLQPYFIKCMVTH